MNTKTNKEPRKKFKLGKIGQNIIMVLLLILGVGVLIYPDIANWYHSNREAAVRQDYNEMVALLQQEEIQHELNRARIFNDGLTGIHIQDPFVPGSGSVRSPEYYSILNFNGIMGRIEIPRIDVDLPIRHGTSDAVLARGAGHMENTPFPVGGLGNHSVITAHTGLVRMRLFTRLIELVEGDYFFIEVLGERLAYRVDFIIEVYPHEIDVLISRDDMDWVTLVTCTPYGINTYRLLVRGERVPYVEGMAEEIVDESTPLNVRVWIIIGFAVLFSIILIFYQRRNKDRKFVRNFSKMLDKEYEELIKERVPDA